MAAAPSLAPSPAAATSCLCYRAAAALPHGAAIHVRLITGAAGNHIAPTALFLGGIQTDAASQRLRF